MEKMLSGFTLDEDSEMPMIRDTFPYESFRLLVYKPVGAGGNPLKMDQEQIESKLRSDLPEVECAMVPAEGTLPVMLLNVDPARDQWMLERIRQLASENAAGEGSPGWVLSESFTSFEQMGVVYRERLVKLIEYRFYYKDRPILVYGELPPMHPCRLPV
ncbi:hypothetical protein Q0F98_30925 [Paenibacillus amylolyticus]|nr:hypothetical protein Q0F98_30925 [Paenibacillus amylolyticus]